MAGDTEYNRHRGVIIATMYVGYCFYHLTRKSFGFIMPVVMEEGLDQSDLGLVISSQTMAYAFSKFLSGLASDHLSARSMFAVGLFLCGVCNVVFILFDSVLLYSLLWFINGLVQGFGWPACAKVLRQWFKPSQFGTWWSILATSMNLAGFVGPLVTMEIATRYGWRAGLLIPVVDEPSHVGLENIVATTQKKTTESKGEAPSMLSLLDSAYLWLISITYFVVFATPLTGYGSPRHPYVISMLATMGLALYGFSDRVEADTLETTIMTIAFLIGFTSYGAINLFGVLAIENSPSSLSGTSSAMWPWLLTVIGGLIAGYPFGLIAENYNWETVFIILEISVAVSLVLFIIARNINTRIETKCKFQQDTTKKPRIPTNAYPIQLNYPWVTAEGVVTVAGGSAAVTVGEDSVVVTGEEEEASVVAGTAVASAAAMAATAVTRPIRTGASSVMVLHGGGVGRSGPNRRMHYSSPGFKYVGYRSNNCNNPAAMAMCPMIAGTVFLIQGCVFTSIGFSAGDKLPPFKVIGPTFLCLAIVLLLLACFCCKKARDAFNQQGGHTVQVVTSSTAPQAPGQTVVTGAPVGHAAPTVMAGHLYSTHNIPQAAGTRPRPLGPPVISRRTTPTNRRTSLHVSADPHVSVSLSVTDKNFGENTVAWMPALWALLRSHGPLPARRLKPANNSGTCELMCLASCIEEPQTNGALSSVVPEFQRVPSASPHRHLPGLTGTPFYHASFDGGAKKPSKEPARTPAKETRNTQCEMLGRRYLRHCQCGLSDLGLLTAAFIGSPTQLKSKAWSQTFLLRFYTAYLATEVTISYIPGGREAETRHVNVCGVWKARSGSSFN
ncbi:hypothetical protein Bbelb_078470 [Branchiostoma belcheri]|nr:hypothetical protein Bbelb_078470 [Branchiostoma belcheri]